MTTLTEKHQKKIEAIIEKLAVLEEQLDGLYMEIETTEENFKDVCRLQDACNLINDACRRLERTL